ncbi:MAG: tyrosine-type recombinase/integrase family protein [Solirubrobacterales bacterium]|nr:tyrosine-type recombinase/integrase family protein [Solirubrobacterales bacterium]
MTASGPYPTAAGTFEVRFREGTKHRSRTFKRESDAGRFMDGLNSAGPGGRKVVKRQDVPTVEVFLAQWLARKKKLAESTRIRYIEAIETHVIPELGHLNLLDLSPSQLQQWQDDRLAAGAGPVVLGRAQSILAQALNKAVLPFEYLNTNPAQYLDKPEHEPADHRWLTAFEVEKIRSQFIEWNDLGSAALVSVLSYVGIRPQDALALEWTDIRGVRLSVVKKNVDGVIMPGSKGGKAYLRTVYLPPMVLADLMAWKAVAPDSNLIFPRAKDGEPWRKHDYENWVSRKQVKRKRGQKPATRKGKCFKLACENAGVGWERKPYDLRHTGATMYVAAGWNHVQVAHQQGNSPAVSTRCYQHLFDAAGHSAEHRDVNDYIREARGMAPADTREAVHA